MAHAYRDIPAAGSKLYIEIGYAMVEIPGISEISWDGFKRGVRSPTPLSATRVPKKPGMPDFGQLKTKCFFDPNDETHQALREKLLQSAGEQGQNLDNFKLEFPDGYDTPAHVLIEGFVSDLSQASGEAEQGTWTADLTIEVNDATFVDGDPPE